jgi:hypothetical protein
MATFNPEDKITVDVPLFIRLLEYAREDAKTDMDLHKVTENAVALSETGKTLTMAQYDAIVKDGGQEDASYASMAAEGTLKESKNKTMKSPINELKRMQQLAGLLKEEQADDSLANQVVKIFNDLSISAEGDEEDGTFNSKLDDELRDLGIKFGFDGGDYISKETLSHLSSDELQSLMQELAAIK